MVLKVWINKEEGDLALQAYPWWSEEQWIMFEADCGDFLEVTIRLGEAGDLDVAQECFLNTSPAVIGWDVVED